ncbi:MAG: hypothetical protein ABI992_11200 [Chthoniobacterales bacterium]
MKRAAAFSLVEVVLALGVIGFALLAIIGLFPIGLQSGRASIQETRANHIAQEIFATMRSQPFNAVKLDLLGNSQTINLSTSNALGPQLFATYDGAFATAADYFTIQIIFNNAPAGLTVATANEVHLRITARETGAPPLNYATVIASY